MKKLELICDNCGKTAKGDEHHYGLPKGWYVLGYHGQTYLAADDWRITCHFCCLKCMDEAVKVLSQSVWMRL